MSHKPRKLLKLIQKPSFNLVRFRSLIGEICFFFWFWMSCFCFCSYCCSFCSFWYYLKFSQNWFSNSFDILVVVVSFVFVVVDVVVVVNVDDVALLVVIEHIIVSFWERESLLRWYNANTDSQLWRNCVSKKIHPYLINYSCYFLIFPEILLIFFWYCSFSWNFSLLWILVQKILHVDNWRFSKPFI